MSQAVRCEPVIGNLPTPLLPYFEKNIIWLCELIIRSTRTRARQRSKIFMTSSRCVEDNKNIQF